MHTIAQLAPKDGAITCVDAASPWADRSRVACGTSLGVVFVLDLPPSAYYTRGAGWTVLARTSPRDTPHRTADARGCAVVDVRLSRSGRRVLATYRHGVVCLFQLQGVPWRGSGGGAHGHAHGKRKPGDPTQMLVPVRVIAPDDDVFIGSPLLHTSSRKDARAVRAAFAPSMNLLGEQGCAVVIMSDGAIVQIALDGPTQCWPLSFVCADATAAATTMPSASVGLGCLSAAMSSLGHQHDGEYDIMHVPAYVGECGAAAGVVVVSSSGRICAWDARVGRHRDVLAAFKPTWTHDIDLTLRTWQALPHSTVHRSVAVHGRNAVEQYVVSFVFVHARQEKFIQCGLS